MKTILKTASLTACAALIATAATAFPLTPLFMGTDDMEAGVLCKVQDVTVLAASAEDCGKIGGMATHSVTTVKKPM
ncbi:hypothetical protein [Roseibium aestuarii]|uniref:Secreted protein n=1 Tax=Roseibium aestuarii TaxID=2600299 RepID=A0ABW4JTJ8_9HYPH|nr:hypothetical protein [Roseibium aestuarii]